MSETDSHETVKKSNIGLKHKRSGHIAHESCYSSSSSCPSGSSKRSRSSSGKNPLSVSSNAKKCRKCPQPGLRITLGSKNEVNGPKTKGISKLQPLSEDVAKVFGDDDDESEEEMPIEARIRMRNKGRETPTSSGPNSFGKSRYGFIDRQALLNRQLEALNEMVSGDNEDQ